MIAQNLPRPRKGILRFGIVKDNKAVEGRIKVEILEQDHVVTRWVPTSHNATLRDKFFHHIPKNSQVVLLMDDNLEDGLILGAIYSTPDPTPEDPIYGKPQDDTLSGIWFAEKENTTEWVGIERFKRDKKNFLQFAKDGTINRNATRQVIHHDGPGEIHDIADQLIHLRAPMICLEGNVTISGVLYMGGVIYGEVVDGGGTCGDGVSSGGGGGGGAPPPTFKERMAKWLAKITAPGSGGEGQDFCYKDKDGREICIFTHHVVSDQEIIDYLFCAGAEEVTSNGQTYHRPPGWTCRIADYGQ